MKNYNITNGQEIYMNQKGTIMFRPHKIRQLNTFCNEKDTNMSLMCASVLERLGRLQNKDEVLLWLAFLHNTSLARALINQRIAPESDMYREESRSVS